MFQSYLSKLFKKETGWRYARTAAMYGEHGEKMFVFLGLFERSEFLIDTSPKKCLRVCPCVRLILVLVLGRQTVYGQKTVYPCLSTYIVFENTHTHSNVPHWLRANRQREATRRQQDTTQAREARCVCVSVPRVGWLQKSFRLVIVPPDLTNGIPPPTLSCVQTPTLD